MAVLSLKNVTLRLGGEPILKNLSVDFWPGHVHALMGPNGAGKSTTAGVIMGLPGYRDHEGDVIYEGESIKHLDVDERARLGISLAWQEPARYEGLGVKEFIGASMAPDVEKVGEALDRVGLDPDKYMDRAVDGTLSGGERKRIELASILAMEPKLVLMDEPDSGIDVEALERIFDALKHFHETGTTVLLITHSLTVLEQAEHAFLFCGGCIVDKGSVDKIGTYYERNCKPCPDQDPMARREVGVGG
jgi:Fe-S cluster assembly ATP-binding protein